MTAVAATAAGFELPMFIQQADRVTGHVVDHQTNHDLMSKQMRNNPTKEAKDGFVRIEKY
jgi:hypothetical protein